MPDVSYTITDDSTGDSYTIMGPDDATDEELTQAISQYLGTQEVQSVPTEEPARSGTVAVPAADDDGFYDVSNDPDHSAAVEKANQEPLPEFTYEEAIQWAEKTVPQDADDYALGIDTISREDPDYSPAFVSRDEKLFLSMANNPRVKLEDLNRFLTSRDKLPYSQEQLDEIRLNREEGTPYGSLEYGNPAEELLGGPYIPMEDPTVGDIGAGLEAGMSENPMGVPTRMLADLFNFDPEIGNPNKITDEIIKERYPGITDEGLEQIRDLVIGERRRRERGNAQYQLEAKDVGLGTELATGFVGGSSPIDIIPLGKGATFGKRAGEAFFFNQAADAIMQGQDIAYGAQDEFDPVRSAMAGATGAALQGAVELPLNVATKLGFAARLGRPDGRLPTPLEPLDQTIPSRTTSDKRTTVYKEETKQATTAVQNRADDIAAEWTNAPKIQAVDSFNKIAGLDNGALGVYRSDGSVLLNTNEILRYASRENLVPDDVVRTVMFHEGLGHHGLASKYGDQLEALMSDIYQNGDIAVRKRVDDWMTAYNSDDYVLATEEVLAEMSEQGQLPSNIIQRLYYVIKDFARQVGFSPKYTTSELRSILSVSQRETTSGAPSSGGGSGDKYMVTYHGSPHDFAPTPNNPLGEFDHSKMGTGEGAQIRGWGTYLTDSERLAESRYRDGLSERTFSWGGTPYYSTYDLREVVRKSVSGKYDEVIDRIESDLGGVLNLPRFVDDLYTALISGTRSDEFVRNYYDDVSEVWGLDGKWSEANWQKFKEAVDPIVSTIDKNLEIKSKGKLYEVYVPDDTKFLEWEEPLSSQPDLIDAVESAGFRVTDYATWNKVNRDAYEARNTYENLNYRLNILDDLIRNEIEHPGPDAANLSRYENEADDLFVQVQEAAIVRNRAIDRAKMYLHEDMDGGSVYESLSSALGGPKEASLKLNEAGIGGNRFLMNNAFKNNPRANDGSDVFNYVIFDDKTPTITNKYMRPYRYEEGKGRLDPNLLNSEELFEADNAFELLDRIIPKNVRAQMSMEELEADAAARKIPPSALLRLVEKDPGHLARSLFMHDIALVRAGERVSNLLAKINSGNYTMDDKDNFFKTVATYEELTERIIGMGSEFGLALRAMQNVTYTKRNLTTIRDTLRDVKGGEGFSGLDDPETFEKFARDLGGQLVQASEKVKRQENPFLSTLNISRALMSSMDLSAPLRQGVFFIGNKEYNNAFLEMHSLFAKDQEYYDALMDGIQKRETYSAMLEARLAFSSVDENTPLSAREEDFQTSLANSVPGVARSNRAFSGFRNQLSADMFDHYFQVAQTAGANVGTMTPDPDTGKLRWSGDDEAKINLRKIGALVNAGTGRGNLSIKDTILGGPTGNKTVDGAVDEVDKILSAMGPFLNSMFFSPKLFFSRLHLLNPVTYYRLPPGVRKEAVTRAAAIGSGYTLALTSLAMAFPEIDVESDPRKSDFGKIRVGNTRYDVLGGFGQYITLGARLATGQRVSSADRVSSISTSPFLEDLHEGFRGMLIYSGVGSAEDYRAAPATQYDKESVLGSFMENKLSPNFSYLNDMRKGENFEGEPFDPVDEALARVMPMYFQDMAELHSELGPGWMGKTFGTIGGLYGIGISTYVPRSLDTKKELEAPETMQDKDLADGENEWVTVSNGTITLKPEAREMYANRLNTYFSEIMEYEMSQQNWSEIERSTQADIIKEARNEAQREARKDMRRLFGID